MEVTIASYTCEGVVVDTNMVWTNMYVFAQEGNIANQGEAEKCRDIAKV
jgi:hypothetical protein